jgi:hypothetical protein
VDEQKALENARNKIVIRLRRISATTEPGYRIACQLFKASLPVCGCRPSSWSYVYTLWQEYARICKHTYIHYMQTHIYTYMYIHTYIYTNLHTNTHIHSNTHIHIHTVHTKQSYEVTNIQSYIQNSSAETVSLYELSLANDSQTSKPYVPSAILSKDFSTAIIKQCCSLSWNCICTICIFQYYTNN